MNKSLYNLMAEMNADECTKWAASQIVKLGRELQEMEIDRNAWLEQSQRLNALVTDFATGMNHARSFMLSSIEVNDSPHARFWLVQHDRDDYFQMAEDAVTHPPENAKTKEEHD